MMKNELRTISSRWAIPVRFLLSFYLFACVQHILFGQASLVQANQFFRLEKSIQSGLIVNSSQTGSPAQDEFASKNNLINNDDGAVWTYTVAGDAWLEVKDNNAVDAAVYKEGSYVGFVMDGNTLTSNGTITTYLGEDLKEIKTGAGIVVTPGESPGTNRVGFWTTKGTGVNNNNFDRVRIEVSLLNVAIPGTVTVYFAEVIRYDSGPALPCNTPTVARLGDGGSGYPVSIVAPGTKFSVFCIGCSIDDQLYLIDDDPMTSAKIKMPVAAVADASISVGTPGQVNPAGTFAGFDLSNSKILGVGVQSEIKLETYLNGVLQEQFPNDNLPALSSAAVPGSERKMIGFETTMDFDEVRLVLHEDNVALGTTEVFGLVLTNFCNDPVLTCNVPTPVQNPTHSVYVDSRHTGIVSTTCTGCGVNNVKYAIDPDPSTAAIISTVLGSNVEASFAVTNAMTTYAENSFAGFDIETRFAATATVFATAKVELLMDGQVVAGSAGAPLLLGASSALTNGTNREIVGVVAKSGVVYNGVKITFVKGAGIDLGDIKIHNAIFQNNCTGTNLACGQTYNLNLPASPVIPQTNFPVVVNLERTGYSGTACAGCYINGAWNVISSDETDYAEIGNVSSVNGVGAISVFNPINTYPAGVVAGFTVKKENFLVAADLFGRLTVMTYNNGVLQEQVSGASLLKITVIAQLYGSETDFYNVGFITKKPFDEIQIKAASLAGLSGGHIKVYGAFIDARTASVDGLRCFNLNPDHNVTLKGIQVAGNLATNDLVATCSTYGTPVATGQPNPGPEVPTLNSDGSYTFKSDVAGIYTFDVPVCVAGAPPCFNEVLTITVQEDGVTDNLPVANDDVTIVKNTLLTPPSVTIDVRANDRPGNGNGTLQVPVIEEEPANGTATVVDGEISYTPDAGFFGKDIIAYKVCETPSGSCSVASLVVTVLSPVASGGLIASDDYMASPGRSQVVSVSPDKGVLSNDKHSDGANLTAVAQDITNAKGRLQLMQDGSYVFTPADNFEGVASFPYQVCDVSNNCQSATLYILTLALPNLVPTMHIDNSLLSAAIGERDFIVKVSEAWNTSTISSGMTVRINKLSGFDITVPGITLTEVYQDGIAGSAEVNGPTAHENQLWQFKQDDHFITATSKAGKMINGSGFADLGFHIARKASTPTQTVQNITVTIIAGAGGETQVTDNISSMQVNEE